MWKLLGLLIVFSVAEAGRLDHKIINGANARVGQFPWQASLQFFGSHSCGGSLIASRWVLSAAHCVGSSTSNYQIILGLHERGNNGVGQPESYNINNIVIHPDYEANGFIGYPNDVALLELAGSANVGGNPYIALVDLAPNDGVDYIGYDCIISGWGYIGGSGPLAGVLQYTETNVISNSECASRTSPSFINEGHICVFTGRNGACSGDSGGPLVCNRSGTYFLAGVTSWVIGACDIGYPSAYSRVSLFYPWIQRVIN